MINKYVYHIFSTPLIPKLKNHLINFHTNWLLCTSIILVWLFYTLLNQGDQTQPWYSRCVPCCVHTLWFFFLILWHSVCLSRYLWALSRQFWKTSILTLVSSLKNFRWYIAQTIHAELVQMGKLGLNLNFFHFIL